MSSVQVAMVVAENSVALQLRYILQPGIWHRLTISEKLAVLQLTLSAGTFVLLVKLVAG